jgi:uncharacterized protein involved in exopolysaccharide biosynthesis
MQAHGIPMPAIASPRRPFHELESTVSVREILGVLFLRKWVVLSMFALVVAAAAFLTFYLLSPTYESSATITIQPSNIVNALSEGIPQSDFEKTVTFQTQKDIIKSGLIAGRVVDRLDLAHKRALSRIEVITGELRAVKRSLGAALGIASWTKPEDPRALSVDAVLDHVEITTKPESQAIKISYRARNAQEAADTVNALVDEFRQYYYGQIRERANGMLGYVDERMQGAEKKLRGSEQALLDFRRRDTLVAPPHATAAQQGKDAGMVGITDSVQVQNEMKTYVLAMEDELRKVLSEYPESAPAARELKARIAAYTQTMNAIPGRELELFRLKRELDVNQNAFLDLRKNYDRVHLIAEGSPDAMRLITVIDAAGPNDNAVSPKPKIAMSLAVVFGLVFGIVAAFCLEYLDHRIRSVQDMERHVGVHLIASIEELKR